MVFESVGLNTKYLALMGGFSNSCMSCMVCWVTRVGRPSNCGQVIKHASQLCHVDFVLPISRAIQTVFAEGFA